MTKTSGATSFNEVRKRIAKEHGEGSLRTVGSEVEDIKKIPTNVLALDQALRGGLPVGRIVELYGNYGSGKSGIAMQFLGSAQEHGICCYFDLENAFNPIHAENSGVNLDDLFFGEADSAEDILQMVDDLLDAQDVSAIVLDSVAGLIPQAKLNGDYGDAYVGTTARLMSDALPLLAQKLKKTETVLVFVNQVREKIGMNGYGPSTSSMGGRALKFWSGVRIDVARIGSVKQGEEVIGQQVRAKLEKNRFAPPFQQATFDILYESGISNESTLMDLAVKAGFIEQKGAWFTVKSTGESIQGKPKVLQLLREDPELADELKAQVL